MLLHQYDPEQFSQALIVFYTKDFHGTITGKLSYRRTNSPLFGTVSLIVAEKKYVDLQLRELLLLKIVLSSFGEIGRHVRLKI